MKTFTLDDDDANWLSYALGTAHGELERRGDHGAAQRVYKLHKEIINQMEKQNGTEKTGE